MATIELEQGETREIIPNDQADREYIAEVYNNNVRIGHSERYAKDGSTLKGSATGNQHKIKNLRGERLFAYAPDGSARIRLSHAAADIDTNPNRDVAILEGDVRITESVDISDRAGREAGKVRMQDSNGTLMTPAKDATLESTLPRAVSELGNTSTISSEAIDPTNSFSDITVPDGMTARIRASSSNADPVVIDGNFELDPGESITLRVTSFADIPVSGTAGDEVQAITHGGA